MWSESALRFFAVDTRFVACRRVDFFARAVFRFFVVVISATSAARRSCRSARLTLRACGESPDVRQQSISSIALRTTGAVAVSRQHEAELRVHGIPVAESSDTSPQVLIP